MAILITVFQCDNCPTITGNKTDEDWQKFETDWFEGFYWQFCPVCREKSETKDRRLADTRMILQLTGQASEEVLNAEFIN